MVMSTMEHLGYAYIKYGNYDASLEVSEGIQIKIILFFFKSLSSCSLPLSSLSPPPPQQQQQQ